MVFFPKYHNLRLISGAEAGHGKTNSNWGLIYQIPGYSSPKVSSSCKQDKSWEIVTVQGRPEKHDDKMQYGLLGRLEHGEKKTKDIIGNPDEIRVKSEV